MRASGFRRRVALTAEEGAWLSEPRSLFTDCAGVPLASQWKAPVEDGGVATWELFVALTLAAYRAGAYEGQAKTVCSGCRHIGKNPGSRSTFTLW